MPTTFQAPEIRLALNTVQTFHQKRRLLQGIESSPSVLVAVPYITALDTFDCRNWMLDSGAYTVFKSGKTIDLDWYIGFALEQQNGPRPPVEIVALDVIGDGPASLRNAESMAAAGVKNLVPVFHAGEDWQLLKAYCAEFPKVGIARGALGYHASKLALSWVERVFALCWPHRFHSFGWLSEKLLMRYPFETADSSSWEFGPTRYGQGWKLGGQATRLSWKGSCQNLACQVNYYLRLEALLRARWAKEMRTLEVK